MARPRSLVPQLHSPLFDCGVGAQEGVRGVQGVTQGIIYRGGGRQHEGARKEEKKTFEHYKKQLCKPRSLVDTTRILKLETELTKPQTKPQSSVDATHTLSHHTHTHTRTHAHTHTRTSTHTHNQHTQLTHTNTRGRRC